MYEKYSDLTEEEKQQARERHMKSYYKYHEERKEKNREKAKKYYEENKEKISQKRKEEYQKKKSARDFRCVEQLSLNSLAVVARYASL